MKRGEDAAAGAEIRMGHVLALDRVLHRERDAAEVVRFHPPSLLLPPKPTGEGGRAIGRRAGRQRRPADTIHASHPLRKCWLVFLDRLDPKMSAGSSPAEARLGTLRCNHVASRALRRRAILLAF